MHNHNHKPKFYRKAEPGEKFVCIRNTPLSGRLDSEESVENTPLVGRQNWWTRMFTPHVKRLLGWALFWTLYLGGCAFIVWALLVKGI